jgi:hypothetical protein
VVSDVCGHVLHTTFFIIHHHCVGFLNWTGVFLSSQLFQFLKFLHLLLVLFLGFFGIGVDVADLNDEIKILRFLVFLLRVVFWPCLRSLALKLWFCGNGRLIERLTWS